MPLNRMIPPDGGATLVTNGRTYTAAAGGFVDAPDFDARILSANGWTHSAPGGVGTTANRPTNPRKGDSFNDNTLGYNIKFNGKNWVNPSTGAVV